MLVEQNLMDDLGREGVRGRDAIRNGIRRFRRVVGKIQVYCSRLDVRASALEEIADMQERMTAPPDPDGEACSDGKDQEGGTNVAKLHLDLFSDGWSR